MTRFQFVADYSTTSCADRSVKRLCELVEIERSSYYAWLKAAPARQARAAADAQLADRIRSIHCEDNTVGAPRVTAELNDGARAGQRVNHKRVARVMRAHGIRGYQRKRRVKTTIPEPADRKVPALSRDFTADAPNLKYVGDITYLPLADGNNLYLAITQHGDRLLLAPPGPAGRSPTTCAPNLSPTHSRPRRQPAAASPERSSTAIVTVYTSKDYAGLCHELGVSRSMGAIGTSADNGLAESFNATLKREVLRDHNTWPDDITCHRQVFRWLVRYNTRRRHSWCNHQSPNTHETSYTTTLPSAA